MICIGSVYVCVSVCERVCVCVCVCVCVEMNVNKQHLLWIEVEYTV